MVVRSPLGERGAARVRVREGEGVRLGNLGRQHKGVPHPSPPPPYIGGRARVRARGRPALACPPSWSPTRTPPWAPFLNSGGPNS